MKKNNILIITGVLILSLAVVLTGCGGGGGGDTSMSGGSDATLTASNAPQAGDAMIQAVKLVAPTTALGEVKTGSLSTEKRAPLMSIFENIAPAVGKRAANGKQSSAVSHQDCSGGGSIDVGTPTPVSLDHVKADVNVNSCTIGTETMNGAMTVTVPVSSLTDLQHVTEFTIEVSNFTYSDAATNTSLSLTDNFTMVANNITYSGNSLTGGSLTLGGTVTGIIDGKPVNIGCDSLGLQFSANSSRVSVSVSGRMSASCLGGWVTISTNQWVTIPSGANCPTAGEIVVGSGVNSVTMSVRTPSSMIDIFFNGTLIQTYNDCNEVIGLCTG